MATRSSGWSCWRARLVAGETATVRDGWTRDRAPCWTDIARDLRPAVDACGPAEIGGLLTGARRALRRAGAVGRADARPARRAADRAQFYSRRQPRGADAGGLDARLEVGRDC